MTIKQKQFELSGGWLLCQLVSKTHKLNYKIIMRSDSVEPIQWLR